MIGLPRPERVCDPFLRQTWGMIAASKPLSQRKKLAAAAADDYVTTCVRVPKKPAVCRRPFLN